jgi:hypothetical protein
VERIHLTLLDVEAGHESAFDDWYRTVHLPAALGRAGWRRAHRYSCTTGAPGYLTVHELEAEAEDALTPFRDESIGRRIRNYHGETYALADAAGAMSPRPALLNVVSTEVAPEHADAFDRWYSEVHVPEIVSCPGWVCARRYRSLDSSARFLAMYELTDESRPFATPEYEAAVGWDEHVGHLRGYHGFRIYRRHYSVERASSGACSTDV